jgi:uncharacterized membrane protein
VRSRNYNALEKMLIGLALAIAAVGLLTIMFIGSAFRMSNITRLDVFSSENMEATVPLFGASSAVVLVCLFLFAWYGLRGKG